MAFSQAASFDARPIGDSDRADAVRRMEVLAQLLDSAFVIPGTQQRIGLDGIIGLVPGIGDAITTVMSSYIIWEARRIGIPNRILARMVANVAIDGAIGLIPFAGDAFDIFFKANRRNMKIVREYLAEAGLGFGQAAHGASRDGAIDAEYRVVKGGGQR